MFNKIRQSHSDMESNITASIVVLLAVFAIAVSMIGAINFANSFKRENSTTTYHIADTASILVNGDHVQAYLNGEEQEEYARTKRILDNYCTKMSVSLIYVICVDQSDYGRFVSVFNSVNNEVDNSIYEEWEIGHKRDTTNSEYAQKYKAIYEDGSAYETVYRLMPGNGIHSHITTIVPVKNTDGVVTALLCVQRPMNELKRVVLRFVSHTVLLAFLLALLATRMSASFSRKHMVLPIRRISAEASRFAKENTIGEGLEDVNSFSEITELARSIDKLEVDMVNYIKNLTAATAEKERFNSELSFARQIQTSSLPNSFPAFPERNEFDIYAFMEPARMVSGDFYNFTLVDDDHLTLWIGDVSGKGIPAALFMMGANIVINNRASMGGTPSEILRFVNENICEHNNSNMFITLWLGILEISSGKLVFANAGHEDPAICHRNGLFDLYKTKHNLALGAMSDSVYNDISIQLEAGDKIFLYTDGVPEASDKDNHMFTLSRMVDALNEHRDGSPQEILGGVHDSVNAFVGDTPQFDDLTMVGLEIKTLPGGDAQAG